MIPIPDGDWRELLVDGVSMKFSSAPNGIKVSTHTFHHVLFESYQNSLAGPWSLYESEDFCCELGNLLQSDPKGELITLRQHNT